MTSYRITIEYKGSPEYILRITGGEEIITEKMGGTLYEEELLVELISPETEEVLDWCQIYLPTSATTMTIMEEAFRALNI